MTLWCCALSSRNRLALLYTTTVFFAREAFRRACLNRAGASTVQVVNLVWCRCATAVLCSGTRACAHVGTTACRSECALRLAWRGSGCAGCLARTLRTMMPACGCLHFRAWWSY